MVKKSGVSKAVFTDFENSPAEPFIPQTDYGAAAGKPAPAASAAKKTVSSGKPGRKTEHTQMDIEDYLRVLKTLGVQDEKRENFFGRLLVRTFEHKLTEANEAPDAEGQVSRSMLPGFFTVLHILLGRSLIERYQSMTKEIVQRTNGSLENIDWNKVYGNQDAKLITQDALVALALHLESIEESAGWFVDLVNDNSSAPHVKITVDEFNWRLTQNTFKGLLGDLFGELRETLATETGRLQMTRRHGAETCIKLVEFMGHLDVLKN
ncbi:MAG: hypothetical protein WD407_01655 [Rhodospirillales bacterium]